MEKWKKAILNNDLAENIITDYRELLSVRINDVDAENIIIRHYTEHDSQCSVDDTCFWFTFALKQWEWGRLSAKVKEKALFLLKQAETNLSEETLTEFKKCLLSPMPPSKKISRPKWISKCPWPVGSLLAYRIISTDYPKVVEGPYWGKYVLLRIVKIERTPVSRLSPESEWRESMIVGLYDWYGDSVPNPEIVNNLKFTPISIMPTFLTSNVLSFVSKEVEKHVDADTASALVDRLSSVRIETCVCLDWTCVKGIDQKEVFTCLGCDPKFGECVSDFFKTDITQYSISHSIPFDVTLANRLAQLDREHEGYGDASRINPNS